MGKKRLRPALVISILALLLIIALPLVLFLFRPPLLIVIDDEFSGLYGVQRTWKKQIEISLKLFRQVKAVRIVSGTGPDVVAFAVESAAETPFAVIFPYRYYEGAGLYAAQSPGIPVAVQTGGAEPINRDDGILYIGTDIKTDFYRAGRFAALFTRSNNGTILLFQGNTAIPGARLAFIEGLLHQGYEKSPVLITGDEEFEINSGFSCAVLVGTAAAFLSKNPAMPMIAFSWLDPAFTSQEVKIIFDDSPWALAVQLASILSGKEEAAPLPSEITAFKSRIGDDELWREIKRIAQNKE